MNHYCTLFNAGYLTRALTMHDSLLNKCKDDFVLYIFCFDDLSYRILSELQLPKVQLITMEQFETDRLMEVKQERESFEYCWTCTPHIIHYVLEHFAVEEVTYLDADLFFFDDPAILIEEFHDSGGSIQITEHRYTPEYDNSATAGKYCVQFMTFKSDDNGMKALEWWGERCLEWCYAVAEDGKFGDQKYIEQFPKLFDGIHVLEHLGGGIACWNVQQYEISKGPSVDGVPVIFYHFTQLTWNAELEFDYGTYPIPEEAEQHFYRPCIRKLKQMIQLIKNRYPGLEIGEKSYFNFLGDTRS